MEGQRRFRGFHSRNGSNLPNLSPERARSGPRRICGEPGEGFGKKDCANDF